ncbi:MAG: hypothetical protein KJO65_06775 [Gemmatimonadetes bacterium]|nr:hypothetical protein [Gemmatimonadota bacterium]
MHESLDQEIQTLQSIFWSERDPDGLAFVSLADAFRRKGAVREALDLLTDGMSRHPDFVTGHAIAAKLYRDQGMDFEAELAARRVLELDPENLIGLSVLAHLLAGKGEIGEAERLGNSVLTVDPDSDEARAFRAVRREIAEPATPEAAEPLPETPVDAGSPESFLDDLTLDDPERDVVDAGMAEEDLAEAMDSLGLIGENEAATVPELPEDLLPGPEIEFEDLDALASDHRATGGATEDEAIDLSAMAPGEAEPEIMELAGLAPDEPDEAEPEAGELVAPVLGESDEGPARTDEPAEPIYTRTLADLYIKQGFDDKALEVLKALRARNPDDTALADRIATLEAGGTPEIKVPEAQIPGDGHSEDEVEARARELAEHGQDGPEAVDTPFAWDTEGSDDGDPDEPPVGDYFDTLLAWEDRAEP